MSSFVSLAIILFCQETCGTHYITSPIMQTRSSSHALSKIIIKTKLFAFATKATEIIGPKNTSLFSLLADCR